MQSSTTEKHQLRTPCAKHFEKLFTGANVGRRAQKIGARHKSVYEMDPRKEKDAKASQVFDRFRLRVVHNPGYRGQLKFVRTGNHRSPSVKKI